MARRGGGLLPPYDSVDTLARLEAEVMELSPQTVVCLGDSFDDMEAERALCEASRSVLGRSMMGRRWIWIAGNHDPKAPGFGGSWMEEVTRGPLTFRHIALPRTHPGEVSGHYHPKVRVQTRAGGVSRACFVRDKRRAILPAFGAYTGGLSCATGALQTLFEEDAVCILTGSVPASVPLKPVPADTILKSA